MMSQFKEELVYEQELINRAINRDEDAFELIWNIYSRRVFALAKGILRDIRDAEDIASEVCFKVWNALPSFRNESAFYTWVHRITINHAKSFLQQKSRYNIFIQNSDIFADEYYHPADKTTPLSEINLLELDAVIKKAIQDLPDKMRNVYIGYEYYGMSYKEIAIAAGCTKGTVMSRLHSARERIQDFLIVNGFSPQEWRT